MESYLQGQDLWEIIDGDEVEQPENAVVLKKWRIKVGKALFAIKTTIEEEMLEHIHNAKASKEAKDPFVELFSKKK